MTTSRRHRGSSVERASACRSGRTRRTPRPPPPCPGRPRRPPRSRPGASAVPVGLFGEVRNTRSGCSPADRARRPGPASRPKSASRAAADPPGAGGLRDQRVHGVRRLEAERAPARAAERLEQLLDDLVGAVGRPHLPPGQPVAEVGGQVGAQRAARPGPGSGSAPPATRRRRPARWPRPAPATAGTGSRWCSAGPARRAAAPRRASCPARSAANPAATPLDHCSCLVRGIRARTAATWAARSSAPPSASMCGATAASAGPVVLDHVDAAQEGQHGQARRCAGRCRRWAARGWTRPGSRRATPGRTGRRRSAPALRTRRASAPARPRSGSPGARAPRRPRRPAPRRCRPPARTRTARPAPPAPAPGAGPRPPAAASGRATRSASPGSVVISRQAASGSCSAWAIRSAATKSGSAVSVGDDRDLGRARLGVGADRAASAAAWPRRRRRCRGR